RPSLSPLFPYTTLFRSIMKAYTFQTLVDLYGDIPYFDALGGSENPNPVYDDARAIYDDLIVQLTAAIELLNLAPENELSVLPGRSEEHTSELQSRENLV